MSTVAKVCGSCTLCCKLLGVTELQKPANVWCHHCAIGKGCKIYGERPSTCKWFECGWLTSATLPIEFRPDNLHMVITGETEQGAIIIHVDPNYPNAPQTTNGKKILDTIAKSNKSVILVIGDKRKLLSTTFKELSAAMETLKKKEEVHND